MFASGRWNKERKLGRAPGGSVGLTAAPNQPNSKNHKEFQSDLCRAAHARIRGPALILLMA
jgi:hypothetical protein